MLAGNIHVATKRDLFSSPSEINSPFGIASSWHSLSLIGAPRLLLSHFRLICVPDLIWSCWMLSLSAFNWKHPSLSPGHSLAQHAVILLPPAEGEAANSSENGLQHQPHLIQCSHVSSWPVVVIYIYLLVTYCFVCVTLRGSLFKHFRKQCILSDVPTSFDPWELDIFTPGTRSLRSVHRDGCPLTSQRADLLREIAVPGLCSMLKIRDYGKFHIKEHCVVRCFKITRINYVNNVDGRSSTTQYASVALLRWLVELFAAVKLKLVISRL